MTFSALQFCNLPQFVGLRQELLMKSATRPSAAGCRRRPKLVFRHGPYGSTGWHGAVARTATWTSAAVAAGRRSCGNRRRTESRAAHPVAAGSFSANRDEYRPWPCREPQPAVRAHRNRRCAPRGNKRPTSRRGRTPHCGAPRRRPLGWQRVDGGARLFPLCAVNCAAIVSANPTASTDSAGAGVFENEASSADSSKPGSSAGNSPHSSDRAGSRTCCN